MCSDGKGGEQGLVGKDIDAPGKPLRSLLDQLHGGCRKYAGAVITSRTHAEVDVVGDIVAHQRLEAEVVGYPLLQLAHVGAGKNVVQLGLAE